MKIAIGADKLGYQLKEAVKVFLTKRGLEVEDWGVQNPEGEQAYYDVADEIAQAVSEKKYERAILVCGTGQGMAIIANKHPGVYAAVCENRFAAEKSRSINNSNILTRGGMITSPETAEQIIETWLETQFTQGWEKPIVDWLNGSMKDIQNLEKTRFKK